VSTGAVEDEGGEIVTVFAVDDVSGADAELANRVGQAPLGLSRWKRPGGDSEIHALEPREVGERQGLDRRLDLSQPLRQRALRDPGGAHGARADDAAAGPGGESGRHLVCHQISELERHARQHDDEPGISLQPEPGRTPPTVGNHDGAAGHLGLCPVALRRNPSQPPVAGDERVPQRLVEVERPVIERGDDALRDVVAGGAEAAGGDDGPGPLECRADRIADLIGPVGDRGAPHHPDADGGELPADLRAVGVHGEPEQQLGADGDDLEIHRGEMLSEPAR
jgi:hypothetical protein